MLLLCLSTRQKHRQPVSTAFQTRVVPFQTGVEFRALSLCLIKCKHTFFHIRLTERGGWGGASQGTLLTDKTEYTASTVYFIARDK